MGRIQDSIKYYEGLLERTIRNECDDQASSRVMEDVEYEGTKTFQFIYKIL